MGVLIGFPKLHGLLKVKAFEPRVHLAEVVGGGNVVALDLKLTGLGHVTGGNDQHFILAFSQFFAQCHNSCHALFLHDPVDVAGKIFQFRTGFGTLDLNHDPAQNPFQ